jgi:hypothetical protein
MALLYGTDVDQRLSWPLGRADRLARQGRLPYVLLPDGSIRFEWPSIEPLVQRIPAGLSLAHGSRGGREVLP